MASCDNCKKGVILPGEPTGKMVDGAYLASGPEGSTSRAIVLLTDIFGLPLKNSKILADNISMRLNCDVWVPDLFDGKPPVTVDQMKVPERAGEKMRWIPFLINALPALPALLRHRPSVAYPKAVTFTEKLQAEKKYGKLGVVGYCFGGTLAVKIAATNLVNSVVIAHPGTVTEAEISAMKAPSSWACAEEDMAFKPELRRKAEELLAARKGKENFVEYEFKDWKGTTHGFAARPNLSYPEVKAGYEGAFEQTIDWFEKTLPV